MSFRIRRRRRVGERRLPSRPAGHSPYVATSNAAHDAADDSVASAADRTSARAAADSHG